MVTQGEYQDKPKLPFIPGSEVSGVVIEVGAGVKSLRVGDKVSPWQGATEPGTAP